jgi:hypothetical protein
MSQSRPSRQYNKNFSLQDYQRNSKVVKEANDAFFAYVETVLDDNELLREEAKVISRENLLLKERVRSNHRTSTFQIFFSFLGGVLVTIGVGLLYSSPHFSVFSPGGFMLGAGIVVTFFVSFLSLITRPRGGNP